MRSCLRLLLLGAASFVAAAWAQTPAVSSMSPEAGALDNMYQPPLAGYQPFTGENVISWQEANEEVGRIGGWRAYARESQQPGATKPAASGGAAAAPAPAAAAPSTAPATPAGHGGHQNH